MVEWKRRGKKTKKRTETNKEVTRTKRKKTNAKCVGKVNVQNEKSLSWMQIIFWNVNKTEINVNESSISSNEKKKIKTEKCPKELKQRKKKYEKEKNNDLAEDLITNKSIYFFDRWPGQRYEKPKSY